MLFRMPLKGGHPPIDELLVMLALRAITRRHEFVERRPHGVVFVVFKGAEEIPFWRKEGDGISFERNNFSFEAAMESASKPDNYLVHDHFETTGDEFRRYYEEACRKHEESFSRAS